MAITEKAVAPTALTTSAATIVTGSTDSAVQSVILTIVIANIHTTTTGTFSASIATSTTVSTATAIGSLIPVPPNSTLVIKGPIMLPTSSNLNMLASANSVFVVSVTYYDN